MEEPALNYLKGLSVVEKEKTIAAMERSVIKELNASGQEDTEQMLHYRFCTKRQYTGSLGKLNNCQIFGVYYMDTNVLDR